MHRFESSKEDVMVCECGRPMKQHSNAGVCENEDCKGVGKLYEDEANNKFICWPCKDKQLQELLDNVNANADKNKQLIQESKELLNGITHNGAFFNAKSISIMDLRRAYLEDKSIAESDRLNKFHESLRDRYFHLKDRIFEANMEQAAIANYLREYGEQVKAEIRGQIQANDANYQPIVRKIPKVKKPNSESPLERLAEILAMDRKISKEAALELIKQGVNKPKAS